MRQAAAVAVGLAVAAVGALVVGEYELGLLAGIAAGAVLGLAVAEAALMTAGERTLPAAHAGALVVAGFAALLWAGWIDVHHRGESIRAGAWLGAVAAAVAVALRTGLGSARNAGSGSPEDSRHRR